MMALTGLRGAPSGGLRVLPNKPLLQILVAGAAVPETHEGTEAAACLSRYRLPRPASPPHFLGAEKSLPTCAASCSATQLDPAHSGSSSGREPCAECRGRNTTRRLPDVYCAPRSLPPQGLCSYCPSGTFSYTLPRTTRRNTRMLSTAYTHAGEDVPTRSRFTKTCPRVSCKCQRPEHGLKRYQNSAT